MPQHLLLAAMQKLCEDMLAEGETSLVQYVSQLPAPLHAALLSSVTTSQGELVLSVQHASLLAALSRSQLFGPKVVSLHLSIHQNPSGEIPDLSLLASCINRQSFLTSLKVTVNISKDDHAGLCDSELISIAQQLPGSMKSLELPGTFRAPALEAIGHALRDLKSLECLSMGNISLNIAHNMKASQLATICLLQVWCSRMSTYLHTLNSLLI
jgi:hypothetical protein